MSDESPLVVCCGSRGWLWPDVIRQALVRAPAGARILHGGAAGADRMSGSAARELGMPVEAMPAEWSRHGRRAGVIRNLAMLAEGPELVLAFNLGTAGTSQMVQAARDQLVAVREYGRDGALWITTPRATFGVELRHGRVVDAAPYARRWIGSTLVEALQRLPIGAETAWLEGAAREPRAVRW